jgi:hypothetical protein
MQLVNRTPGYHLDPGTEPTDPAWSTRSARNSDKTHSAGMQPRPQNHSE